MAPRIIALAVAVCGVLITASCGSDLTPTPPPPVKIAVIQIDSGSRQLERGSVVTLNATARDAANKIVASIPFAWRSSADSVASVDFNGKLIAGVPGTALVTASALGVTSSAITVTVVWLGAAQIAVFQFTPPNAITPGSAPTDSIRVAVTNTGGFVAKGARVAFAVTGGGGSITPSSPAIVTVGTSGIAAAKWVLGSKVGVNTVTATVVGADDLQVPWVKPNQVTFTVKAYDALTVVQGDAQTGPLLSPLPVIPSVRLVDSAGKPRAGVPIAFSVTGNGRVADVVASTSVDGVASPGVWTLGDSTGAEQLTATVESATLVLRATATGTAVHYAASHVFAAGLATCVQTSDQFTSCMGAVSLLGAADSLNTSSPKLTKGGVKLTSLAGGTSHYCGTTAQLEIYCWGNFALVDTLNGLSGSGVTVLPPTKLQSNIGWIQVTPGGQHNCALASDHVAYCWGSDTTGQLGDNSLARHLVPRPVAGGFKFNSLAAGDSHECGITTDQLAFCWGANNTGQLGDGSQTLRQSPTAVSGNLHWKTIQANLTWTCGLITDGTPYCWGGHTFSKIPIVVPSAPVLTSLTVGGDHACGLTADGTVYCWGDNDVAQLGDPVLVQTRATAAPVATTLRFASVSAGIDHTCGITTDGFLACWGLNTSGEIGLTGLVVQVTPRYVVVGVKP